MIDINQYVEYGYVHIKGFFDKENVSKVRKDAKKIFKFLILKEKLSSISDLEDENKFNESLYKLFDINLEAIINGGKQIQHLISLHELSLNRDLIDLLQAVGLKFPVISTRPVLFFNHPRLSKKEVYYKTPPHQDWRSMQGSLNSAVVWVPLMDIDYEIGALQVAPGSHRLGLLTDEMKDSFGLVSYDKINENEYISVPVKAGDILIFSSFLVHRSGNNISNQPRWSCHFRYNDIEESSFIKRNFAHPYIYHPREDLITPDFPKQHEIDRIFKI